MKNVRKPFEPEIVTAKGPGVDHWHRPDDNNHDVLREADVLARSANRLAFLESRQRLIDEKLRSK